MPELVSKTFARVLSVVAILAFLALAAFLLIEISTRVSHFSAVPHINGGSHSDLAGVVATLWVVGFFGFGFVWSTWFGGRQWLGRLVGLFLALVVVIFYKAIILSAAERTPHAVPPKRQAVLEANVDAKLAELAPIVEALRNFQVGSPIPSIGDIRKSIVDGTLDASALQAQLQATMLAQFAEAIPYTSHDAIALYLAARLRVLEDLTRISPDACVAEIEGRALPVEVMTAAVNAETKNALLAGMTAVFRDAAARTPRPKSDPALIERTSRTVSARLVAEGIDAKELVSDATIPADRRCAAHRALYKHTLALAAPARAAMMQYLLTEP